MAHTNDDSENVGSNDFANLEEKKFFAEVKLKNAEKSGRTGDAADARAELKEADTGLAQIAAQEVAAQEAAQAAAVKMAAKEAGKAAAKVGAVKSKLKAAGNEAAREAAEIGKFASNNDLGPNEKLDQLDEGLANLKQQNIKAGVAADPVPKQAQAALKKAYSGVKSAIQSLDETVSRSENLSLTWEVDYVDCQKAKENLSSALKELDSAVAKGKELGIDASAAKTLKESGANSLEKAAASAVGQMKAKPKQMHVVLSEKATKALGEIQKRLKTGKVSKKELNKLGFDDDSLARMASFHGGSQEALITKMSKASKESLALMINDLRVPVKMAENQYNTPDYKSRLPHGSVYQVLSGTVVSSSALAYAKGTRRHGWESKANRRDEPHAVIESFVSGLMLVGGEDRSKLDAKATPAEKKAFIKEELADRLSAMFKAELAACPDGQTRSFIIPGIGAGFFAGGYDAVVKEVLDTVLEETLNGLSSSEKDKISAVVLDTHSGGKERVVSTARYVATSSGGQLATIPTSKELHDYAREKDASHQVDWQNDTVVKVVAWDMLSYMTNEGINGSPASDDGVAGVSSDVIERCFGIEKSKKGELGTKKFSDGNFSICLMTEGKDITPVEVPLHEMPAITDLKKQEFHPENMYFADPSVAQSYVKSGDAVKLFGLLQEKAEKLLEMRVNSPQLADTEVKLSQILSVAKSLQGGINKGDFGEYSESDKKAISGSCTSIEKASKAQQEFKKLNQVIEKLKSVPHGGNPLEALVKLKVISADIPNKIEHANQSVTQEQSKLHVEIREISAVIEEKHFVKIDKFIGAIEKAASKSKCFSKGANLEHSKSIIREFGKVILSKIPGFIAEKGRSGVLKEILKFSTEDFEKEVDRFQGLREKPRGSDIAQYMTAKENFASAINDYYTVLGGQERKGFVLKEREDAAGKLEKKDQEFLRGLGGSGIKELFDLGSKLELQRPSSSYQGNIQNLIATHHAREKKPIKEAYEGGSSAAPLKAGFGLKEYLMDLTKRPCLERGTMIATLNKAGLLEEANPSKHVGGHSNILGALVAMKKDKSSLNPGCHQQISLGDTHGNVVKLVNFLAAHDVIDFKGETKEDKDSVYQELRDVYREFESISITESEEGSTRRGGSIDRPQVLKTHLSWSEKERLTVAKGRYEAVLDKIKVNVDGPTAVHLIGDEMCDRGANDFLNLKFLKKLKVGLEKKGGQLKGIVSDHGIDGLARLERDSDLTEKTGTYMIEGGTAASSIRMQQMVNSGLVSKEEVKSLYQETLLSTYQLLDASLEGDKLIISFHGAGSFSAIFEQADKMGIKPEKYGMTKDDEGLYNFTNEQMMFLIDKINEDFSTHIQSGKATKKGGHFDYAAMKVERKDQHLRGNTITPGNSATQMIWAYNITKKDYDINQKYMSKPDVNVSFRIGHIGGGSLVKVLEKKPPEVAGERPRYAGVQDFENHYQNLDSDVGKPTGRGESHQKDILPIGHSAHDPNLRAKRKQFEMLQKDKYADVAARGSHGQVKALLTKIKETITKSSCHGENPMASLADYKALNKQVGLLEDMVNEIDGSVIFSSAQENQQKAAWTEIDALVGGVKENKAVAVWQGQMDILVKMQECIGFFKGETAADHQALDASLGELREKYEEIESTPGVELSEKQTKDIQGMWNDIGELKIKLDERQENNAASKVQRVFRGDVGRKVAKEAKAATTVQRVFRGDAGRKIAKEAKADHHFNEIMNGKDLGGSLKEQEAIVDKNFSEITEIKAELKELGAEYTKAVTVTEKFDLKEKITKLGAKLEKPYIAMEEAKAKIKELKTPHSKDLLFLQGEIKDIKKQIGGMKAGSPEKANLKRVLKQKIKNFKVISGQSTKRGSLFKSGTSVNKRLRGKDLSKRSSRTSKPKNDGPKPPRDRSPSL